MSILNEPTSFLRGELERNQLAIKLTGILGFFAHPIYYLVWTYVLPQPYDNLPLRLSVAFFCFPLIFQNYWPKRFEIWLPVYWWFCLVCALPFICTFLAVKNSFSTMWMMTEVMMIFVMALCIEYATLLVLLFVLGISTGFLTAVWTSASPLVLTESDWANLALLPVILICSTACSEAIKRGRLVAERNKAITALAGSIAHEMRTPLSQASMSLNSIGELLSANDAPIPAALVPKISRFVSMGKTSIERGHQVIDMILGALKSDVVDRSKFVPLSAAQATQKAIDEYNFPECSARDKSSNLRDRVSVTVVKDFTFNGDETAYMFVLFNLMKNALYYFGQKPEATLVMTVDDYKVKVRDTGPGMPKKVLSQLFASFMTSGKAEGTGLGLSYCKRAMQGFGGDITCNSVEGEFTQFTLTFPALTPEKSRNHENAEVARAQARLPVHDIPPPDGNDEAIAAESALTGKTVILAEDNTNSREIVSWCLEGWGLTVLGAENGQKVLHYLEHAAHVDLILMDMDMPILNGVQTAGAIRSQRGAHQNVPILALTGNSDPASIKATITAGMNDFVVKTGDMKALREKILTLMQPNLPR